MLCCGITRHTFSHSREEKTRMRDCYWKHPGLLPRNLYITSHGRRPIGSVELRRNADHSGDRQEGAPTMTTSSWIQCVCATPRFWCSHRLHSRSAYSHPSSGAPTRGREAGRLAEHSSDSTHRERSPAGSSLCGRAKARAHTAAIPPQCVPPLP